MSERLRHIPALLERHAEEIEFLAGLRRNALHSPVQTVRDYTQFHQRILAHVQGLHVSPDAAIEQLLPRLAGEDRDAVFAGALPLLHLFATRAVEPVCEAFRNATGPALEGLREALGFPPFSPLSLAALKTAQEESPAPVASAAAMALANLDALDPAAPRLAGLLEDPDAEVSCGAWRAVAIADARHRTEAPPRPYRAGLMHDDPRVRDAALATAAWTAQPWLLAAVRRMAGGGDAVALVWLAVAGTPEDVPSLRAAAAAMEDPAARCDIVARHGHPGHFADLLAWMEDPDVLLASEAGESFTRMTGCEVQAARKEVPPLEGADEFEREFTPVVWVPDPVRAREFLRQHRDRLAAGLRWRRGVDLGTAIPPGFLAEADMQARWDACARAAAAGTPVAAPPPAL